MSIQKRWSHMADKEGTDWEELWVLGEALCQWGARARGKLIFARITDAAAMAPANYGAGRLPSVNSFGPSREGVELVCGSTAPALHIPGRGNSIADALSRTLSRRVGEARTPSRG